jgi:hypothetical protein
MPRVKIGGFSKPGLVADKPGYDLSPDAFTEVRNARMNFRGAEAFIGERLITSAVGTVPRWVKAFPPITSPLWLYAGLDKVVAWDGVLHTDLTRITGPYNAIASERWQGEILNGVGFFNNTIDVPQMWLAFNTGTKLADLTFWPADVRCKALRPFKYFLFAIYTIEGGSDRPYRFRWSHSANPGTIPASWALADPTKDSGEFDIAETDDYLVDGLALGENFIVYKQRNVHLVQYVGRPNIFAQWRIIPGRGLLARDCMHSFPGGHFVAGIDDIYVHSGQRGSEQSLLEGALRRRIFAQIDSTNYFNCYVVNYEILGESWFCFPEQGATYPTQALVWNRFTGGVGLRDLDNCPFIFSGTLPPVGDDNGTWNS